MQQYAAAEIRSVARRARVAQDTKADDAITKNMQNDLRKFMVDNGIQAVRIDADTLVRLHTDRRALPRGLSESVFAETAAERGFFDAVAAKCATVKASNARKVTEFRRQHNLTKRTARRRTAASAATAETAKTAKAAAPAGTTAPATPAAPADAAAARGAGGRGKRRSAPPSPPPPRRRRAPGDSAPHA